MKINEKTLLKITRDTKLWKNGQKVWQLFGTGAMACLAIGKYKGNGRWIKAWVHWEDENGKGFFCKPDCKWIGPVKIRPKFYGYLKELSGDLTP